MQYGELVVSIDSHTWIIDLKARKSREGTVLAKEPIPFVKDYKQADMILEKYIGAEAALDFRKFCHWVFVEPPPTVNVWFDIYVKNHCYAVGEVVREILSRTGSIWYCYNAITEAEILTRLKKGERPRVITIYRMMDPSLIESYATFGVLNFMIYDHGFHPNYYHTIMETKDRGVMERILTKDLLQGIILWIMKFEYPEPANVSGKLERPEDLAGCEHSGN